MDFENWCGVFNRDCHSLFESPNLQDGNAVESGRLNVPEYILEGLSRFLDALSDREQ